MTNQKVAAFVTYITARYVSAVMSCFFRLFCWKISQSTAAKLNDKCLFGITSCLDIVTIVKEKLEGVSGKRCVTEADNVRLYRVGLLKLLIIHRNMRRSLRLWEVLHL